jgi:hypothetical protein
MASAEAIRDEQRRVRRVQAIAHVTTSLLMQARLSRVDGEALVAYARDRILELFPGRDETYEILYGRRFRRLLDECTGVERSGRPAVVVPFPSSR